MNTQPKPHKIIWVVIDTLRADHLGLYGYPRPTSPFLDSLGHESLVFDWAFSTCCYSNPSHASMLTGQYCSNHFQRFSNHAPVEKPLKGQLLTEALNSRGYVTASFFQPESPLQLPGSVGHLGFREQFCPDQKSGPKCLNKTLESFLRQHLDDDLFCFINYFNVHGPYRHPEPYRNLFTSDQLFGPPFHFRRIRPAADPLGGLPECQILEAKTNHGLLREYQTDLRHYLARYDAGIREVDQALEKLAAFLKQSCLYDQTLLLVTADHGEAFGENNLYCSHGYTLTPDQIHVPLIMKPHQGWAIKPARIKTQVSLVDIMPTILELTGQAPGDRRLDGRSLVGLIQKGDNELKERPVLAETRFQTCAIGPKHLRITPRPKNEIEALRPKTKEITGHNPGPNMVVHLKQELGLDYREKGPSPLVDPPKEFFYKPPPSMNEDKLNSTLQNLRQEAVAEFMYSRGILVPHLDHLCCELNRLRGELNSIPSPIRSLTRTLRSWSWLHGIVGRIRRMGRKNGQE